MKNVYCHSGRKINFLYGAFALFLVYLTSHHSFLLFHSLAEIFSIVIACGIFMIAWNARNFLKNNYFMFIGIAYLFIGGLDAVHTLAYKGMNIFKGHDANLPTQLWIAARYMESVTLLAAPFLIEKKLDAERTFHVYLSVALLLAASIFYWRVFPDCYIEGQGLTAFKKASEYAICALLSCALYMLVRRKRDFDPAVHKLLCVSIALTIAAELAFTFYVSVYGFSNLVGHIFKIVSFYLIYKAIIETGLRRPYDLMFKELSDKEMRYRQVFETNQAIKLVIDPGDGAIVDANEAACRFYGYSRDRIKKLNIMQINALPPEQVRDEMNRALSEKKLYFNFPHRLASGEIRDVEVYSGPVKTCRGDLLYSIVHDVTDRNKTDAALRESLARYGLLFDSVREAILVHQPTPDGGPGKLVEVNSAACDRYGYSRQELMEMTLADLAAPEQKAMVRRRMEEIFSEKHVLFESVHVNRDGVEIPVEVSAHLSCIQDTPAILSIVRNIAARKRAERERIQYETRIRQAEKLEALGALAGGIAHDFNNILSSIIGFTELALEDVEEGGILEENLEEVYTAGIRAKELVGRILTFARRSDERTRPVEIGLIVREALKLIRPSLPSTIEIEQSIESRSTILGSPAQAHQIVMNLCANAAHAMRENGGRLKVLLKDVDTDRPIKTAYGELKPGKYVKLVVSDNGEGIAPDVIESIFEPYFTTKAVGEGTGMGLAVTLGIVESHGGKIAVESVPGEGTSFAIYLPVIETPSVEKEYRGEDFPTGTEHILFVDDEESIAIMGARTLENMGYSVTVSNRGSEALEFFKHDPGAFDLVITDMTMPGMTGDRLASAVKMIRPDIPVILCTGYSSKISDGPPPELDLAGFAYKPVVKADLAKLVRKALDEARTRSAEALERRCAIFRGP